MANVESRMLAYIQQRISAGAPAVPESEVMNAVIPPQHPEYRYRPAYRHGLERLLRRHKINGRMDSKGESHYFLEDYPSKELEEWISNQ